MLWVISDSVVSVCEITGQELDEGLVVVPQLCLESSYCPWWALTDGDGWLWTPSYPLGYNSFFPSVLLILHLLLCILEAIHYSKSEKRYCNFHCWSCAWWGFSLQVCPQHKWNRACRGQLLQLIKAMCWNMLVPSKGGMMSCSGNSDTVGSPLEKMCFLLWHQI